MILEQVLSLKISDTFIPLDSISHLPVLKYILDNLPIKSVLEYGLGYGSTKLFLSHKCELTSVESDPVWCQKFSHNIIHCRPADYIINGAYDLIFIDCHPSEDRVHCLQKAFGHTSIIVAHDTQPSSENEYGYSKIKIPTDWQWLDCQLKDCWTTVFTNDPNVLEVLKMMSVFNDDDLIKICQETNNTGSNK